MSCCLLPEWHEFASKWKDPVYSRNALGTLADTMEAHQLGGFKVGVGFALKKCQVCCSNLRRYPNILRYSVRQYSVVA